MDNSIESTYVIKIDEVLRNLKLVDETIGGVEDTINKTGKNQSFSVLSQSVQRFNATLADGSKVYRSLETGAKAYKDEIDRLRTAEIALIKSQAEFKNSMEYDEAQKNLVAVRARINELNQAIANTAKTTEDSVKKSENIFERFGSKVKSVGIAVAAYFTVDAIASFEGKIIESTKAYEKYYAVLRNGFQDENKASESMAMIYDFASKTPFAVTELTESYIKLVNRGFTPTREELTKLGDLASSQGKSFNQLTEAVLDAMSGEFERLKEFGIRAKTVGDNVTLSFKGQEVTVNKFNQGALKEAVLGFGALQGVTGSMGAVSLTLEGQISNLGDSFDQLLVSLGRSQGFLGGVIGLFGSLINTIKDFVDVPVTTKLIEENTELNALAGALILANNNQSVRNALLTEIGQKYPSFLALLGKESDNNYAIANALTLVNEQYRIKIRLAGEDVLAKRNAEKVADSIESTTAAIKKADVVLKSVGSSANEFQNATLQQQKRIIQQIKEQTKDTAVSGGGFGGTILQTGLKNKSVEIFETINKLTQKQNEQELEGVEIQNRKAKTSLDLVNVKNSQIEGMKKENEILGKNLISAERFKKIMSFDYKNEKEVQQVSNFQKFQANKEQIITFAKQGVQEDITPKPTTTSMAKGEKPKLKEVQDEFEKLLKAETDYQEKLNKIQLDAKNTRLSLLDKDSQKYLDEKLVYDLEVLESERQSFIKLYEIELSQTLLKDELSKRKGKILEAELEKLKETTLAKAKVLSSGNGEFSFNNSNATQAQNGLLSAKGDLIKAQFGENRNRLEDKINKEQIDRLDLQNSLLGDGLDKQIAIIISKYAKLIEANQKNADTIKVLEAKRTEEILNSTFKNADKNIDNTLSSKKTSIGNRTQSSGETMIEFDLKNKKDLLDADKVYYADKIKLLKEYLLGSQYANLVGLGIVSSEEDKANKERLKSLEENLHKSDKATKNYVALNALSALKYEGVWEKVSAVFKTITGKAIKFSQDPELDKAINEAFENTLNSLSNTFKQSKQMELQASDDRISILNDEISKKESIVNAEYENFKLGLANNYLEEKKNFEFKKKERDAEILQKKKLQKEQANLDALAITSSNLLTVALTIEAIAGAFKSKSTIPFGILLALADVAIILSTIQSVKAKTTQKRYGGYLRGNLHGSGEDIPVGNTGISVEGGEFISRRDVVDKSPELFETINKGSFGTLDFARQNELLKPFGLKQMENVSFHVKQGLGNQQRINLHNQRTNDRHFESIDNSMGRIADNTSRIPKHQIVSNEKETMKFDSNGKLIEIMKNE